jgi:hypothetical protein
VPRRLTIVVLGLVTFLAISLVLARWLSTETRERNAVYALLRAQARGDAPGMLARLDGCAARPACRAQVRANARRLRRTGAVKILAYRSHTAYALGRASGLTRVAWTVIDRGLPVVQCVVVQRKGTVLAGRTVTLQRLSAPIGRESDC